MMSLTAIEASAFARRTAIPAVQAEIGLKNARVLTQRSEQFGRLHVELFSCESNQPNELQVFVPNHCLLMRCEGRSSRCEIQWLDDGPRQVLSELKPGSILFNPALRHVRVTKKDHGPFVFISLQIPPSALEDLEDVNTEIAGLALMPQAGMGEAELCRVLFAMRDEVDDTGAVGRLYRDALALQLLVQLLRRASGLTVAPKVARGGLSARQLRQAIELLEADLTETTSLRQLAAHVGLSPAHLCTAFKQSTGYPPHRYLLNRRIDHAKNLMADPRLNLTEIALSSGFGSSSQFATVFRRFAGVTPSVYRRSL